ncbi:MAG: HAMP domain-containing histidine kinase [Actinomycetota bacterium]|nr:HAMP domain-containing histidine kinase [Actinomycetota bacterium]
MSTVASPLANLRGDLFDVARLADAVMAEMAILAEQSGVAPTRSGANTAAMVRESRTALRRAIKALVDNAIGHTGPTDTIDVGITMDAEHIGIAVTDNGEGLGGQTPAELVRRFARGAQLVRRNNSDPGFGPAGRRFGLGLSLVQEIAQAHRGELSCPSGREGERSPN